MPTLFGDDDAEGLVEVEREHAATRLLQRGAVDLLPPSVELLELAGDDVGFVLALGREQLDAALRQTETADRVEARGEDVADASCGERLSLESRGTDERAESQVLRLGKHLEAVAREHAILAAQRRDVGDRRERDEIEHPEDAVLVAAERARDGQRELERHADGGEVLVLRSAAG